MTEKEGKVEEHYVKDNSIRIEGVWYVPIGNANTFVSEKLKDKTVRITGIKELDGKRTFNYIKLQKDETPKVQSTLNEAPVVETGEIKVNKNHIIRLQGKEYITHAGLLDFAYTKCSLHSIETELVRHDNEISIVKAIASIHTESGFKYFHGIGDASKASVNSMIEPHRLRMAETRAINRALRLLTNIGMTSAEELGGDDPPSSIPDKLGEKATSVPTKESYTKSKEFPGVKIVKE